jgi:hypothetical protein
MTPQEIAVHNKQITRVGIEVTIIRRLCLQDGIDPNIGRESWADYYTRARDIIAKDQTIPSDHAPWDGRLPAYIAPFRMIK